MKNKLTIWFFVAFLLSVSGLAAQPNLSAPPVGGIYDPVRVLDEDFSQTIRQKIAYEKTYREMELFVILLPQPPAKPVEKLAREVGEAWATGEFWCVIYQVGPTAEPNCVVGGRLMEELGEERLAKTILIARNIAMMVRTPQNRLEEFVNNIAERFGLLHKIAKKNFEEAVTEAAEENLRKQKRKDMVKFAFGFLGLILLLLLFGGFYFLRKLVRKFLPQEFPLTSARKRLGGPATGGGDVLVKYKK